MTSSFCQPFMPPVLALQVLTKGVCLADSDLIKWRLNILIGQKAMIHCLRPCIMLVGHLHASLYLKTRRANVGSYNR